MAFLDMEVKGAKALQTFLHKYGRDAVNILGNALYHEGENIMRAAKEITPVDTGALRASGHVQRPRVNGYSVSVTLGFGGTSAPYAIYVHERLDVRHVVGQAKFLERPFREAAPGIPQRIARYVRDSRKGSVNVPYG